MQWENNYSINIFELLCHVCKSIAQRYDTFYALWVAELLDDTLAVAVGSKWIDRSNSYQWNKKCYSKTIIICILALSSSSAFLRQNLTSSYLLYHLRPPKRWIRVMTEVVKVTSAKLKKCHASCIHCALHCGRFKKSPAWWDQRLIENRGISGDVSIWFIFSLMLVSTSKIYYLFLSSMTEQIKTILSVEDTICWDVNFLLSEAFARSAWDGFWKGLTTCCTVPLAHQLYFDKHHSSGWCIIHDH